MSAPQTFTTRAATPVERVLRREHWSWFDYIAAGEREFDGLYVDSNGAPTPFAPGNRAEWAVGFARHACPAWKRLLAVEHARAGEMDRG